MRAIDPPLNYLGWQPTVLNPPKSWDEKDGKCLPITGLRSDDAQEICFFFKPTDEELVDLMNGGSVEITFKYVGSPVVPPMSLATVPRRYDEQQRG